MTASATHTGTGKPVPYGSENGNPRSGTAFPVSFRVFISVFSVKKNGLTSVSPFFYSFISL